MERRESRLIRDALEAVLAPERAARAFAEALRSMPEAFDSLEDTVAFVDGPIRRAVVAVHGAAGDDVVDDLLRAFTTDRPARRRDEDSTQEIRLDERVHVFILSSGESLAQILTRETPFAEITIVTYDDEPGVRRAIGLRAPGIVVVDGADFPKIEPSDLPSVFRALPPSTVRAVWATDAPYGAAAVAALVASSVAFTPLDRREGISPVVDLVRARAKA